MSLNNHSQIELNQQLDELLESYFVKYSTHKCYTGLIFKQGGRNMVQINVPGEHIPDLLQTKPSTNNDPDSAKDRPEIKGHAEEIKEYIIERIGQNKPWILGTITANVAPEMISIIELVKNICLIIIPSEVKLELADGQHRKIAIESLNKKGNMVKNEYFPITLILEGNLKQCQADFRDLAQAKPIDKSLLLSFSDSVGRVGITKKLIQTVGMFNGKTDKINKTPSNNKKLIYTTKYIATAVSLAFTDNPNDELENYDVEKSSKALTKCLNQFFSECGNSKYISETEVEKLSLEEIIAF